VPAAISYADEHDWARVRMQAHALAMYAMDVIADLSGVACPIPGASDWFAQMCIARLPACDAHQLHMRLWDEYQIEVPIVRWQGEPYVRVSVQGYNSLTDIERLVSALKELLPELSA